MNNTQHTPGSWQSDSVSDCARVYVGTGRKRINLARLNPKQLSETETCANAKVMAAAPDMLAALKAWRAYECEFAASGLSWDELQTMVQAAIAKAEAKQ